MLLLCLPKFLQFNILPPLNRDALPFIKRITKSLIINFLHSKHRRIDNNQRKIHARADKIVEIFVFSIEFPVDPKRMTNSDLLTLCIP